MSSEAELTAAARSAAPEWGLEIEDLELISHTENAVFRVDTTAGRRVVMRLHRPGYNTLPEMHSELLWVDALGEAGLETPVQLRTLSGEGYATAQAGAEERVVGVIDWIPGVRMGEALYQDPSLAPTLYRTIGELAARIHLHSESWQPPAGFVRRRWDDEGLVGPDPLWGRFWETSILTDRQRSLFERGRAEIFKTLNALPQDSSMFGLIHADLHLNNVLVDGDDLTIIDFDDAGFGWYLHELAVTLESASDEPWYDDAFAALVEGYRSIRPLSDDELALLPVFITQRTLMIVAWMDARPELGLETQIAYAINAASESTERLLAGNL